MRSALLIVCLSVWLLSSAPAIAEPPKPLDADLVMELVASEPEIVTPVGLVVDDKHRIWAIENHTHQTKPEYEGPKSDRIRVFEDLDEASPQKSDATANWRRNC